MEPQKLTLHRRRHGTVEIPDYQRRYAWGDKQLNDVWQDRDLLGSAGTQP